MAKGENAAYGPQSPEAFTHGCPCSEPYVALAMNPNVEAVEAVEVPRPLSLFQHFYDFLYNVLALFYNILLGPVLNILAISTTQGRLYLCSLIQRVRVSAGKFGHKGRMKSKDLVSGRFLGQGCSGMFYETTWSPSQDSTVRLARKDFPGVKGDIFEREVVRLFELDNHPNVVKTLGWTVDERSCSLVMEYVRDDLSSLMRRKKEAQREKANQPVIGTSLAIFQPHEVMDIALQIAIGMDYLHDKGITHGDLKPNNVLIDWKEGQLLVKVADFGLIETKRRSTLISQRALCFGMIEWSAPELFEDYFGSLSEDLDYLWTESPTGSDISTLSTSNIEDSPEILIPEADSYSFGLTCAYILGGQMWDAKLSPNELRRQISSSGLRPKLPSECPEALTSLISLCWDNNPKRRPPFSFIRNRLQEIMKEQSTLEVTSSRSFAEHLDVKEMVKDQKHLAAQRELQEEEFSQLKPAEIESMDPVERLSQVSEGLRIIEDVTGFSGKFLMNKQQCESLANRLHAIGKKLKELPEIRGNKCSDGSDQMINPAFDFLLLILRKAQALLWKYLESRRSMASVLTRREDREAFKLIHADLDMLNSLFHFEDFEDVTSEGEKIAMLTRDADEDLNELRESLQDLAYGDDYKKAAEEIVLPTNVERVKMMVSEKSDGTSTSDHDLPRYLSIDPASVEIRNPVRIPERLSDHEPLETFGWALVRYGSWLGCPCALKVFSSGDSTWNRNELLKEVRSLMELRHPHIVQLIGFAQDAEKCIILMELMDTDLRHFMGHRSGNGKRPFTQAQEMDIISQIAKGMYYMHEHQYVHGELKCSNILVKQFDDYIDVKISDFRSSQKLGVWDPVVFKELCSRGRPRWTAPEVEKYGEVEPTHAQLKKTDVYSFGMVCYEVVTGKLPFQDLRGSELKRRIETGDLKQELPGELDDNLRGLIETCWARDPNDRPTFEKICHRLDHIRSSQFAFTDRSSVFDTVMRRLKPIPSALRPGGRKERIDPSAISSWGHTVEQQGDIDLVEPNAVASPEFVIIDPAGLKKGTSWRHTDLKCTGDGDRDDDDEEREGEGSEELDSAEVGANVAITLPEFVRINPANLKLERLIGKGSFADVYAGSWLGSKFAVKRFKSIQAREVEKELKLLCELRHPCIVQLMGVSVRSESECSIVMELMSGDLRNLINSRMQERNPLAEPVFNLQKQIMRTAWTAVVRDNLRQVTVSKKLNKTMGPILARDLHYPSCRTLGVRNKAKILHKRNKAKVLHKRNKTSVSHKRNKTNVSHKQTKATMSRKCNSASVCSKRTSKASRPDVVGSDSQQHSDLRKSNRIFEQVLEGAERLQQHINSRKPKEVKRPAVLHDIVPFDLDEAMHIITRIALGMAFLHSRGVAHRDLKAANILVPEHSASIDVKITDFGVAQIIGSSEKPTLGVGTGFWMAPEMFRRRLSEDIDDQQMWNFDLKAADVYSFAMTCYEVLTGKIPLEDEIEHYSGLAALRSAVVAGLRPKLPSDLNSDLKLLIEECWDGDPKKRPPFSRICQVLICMQLNSTMISERAI